MADYQAIIDWLRNTASDVGGHLDAGYRATLGPADQAIGQAIGQTTQDMLHPEARAPDPATLALYRRFDPQDEARAWRDAQRGDRAVSMAAGMTGALAPGVTPKALALRRMALEEASAAQKAAGQVGRQIGGYVDPNAPGAALPAEEAAANRNLLRALREFGGSFDTRGPEELDRPYMESIGNERWRRIQDTADWLRSKKPGDIQKLSTTAGVEADRVNAEAALNLHEYAVGIDPLSLQRKAQLKAKLRQMDEAAPATPAAPAVSAQEENRLLNEAAAKRGSRLRFIDEDSTSNQRPR